MMGGSIDLPLTSSIADGRFTWTPEITATPQSHQRIRHLTTYSYINIGDHSISRSPHQLHDIDALPLGITLNSDGTFSGTVSHGATTNAISPQNFTFNWRYNDGADNDADETGTIEVTNDNRLPTINLPENIVRTVAELTPVTLPRR